MSALQKINLGTAPEGKDGDTVRTGFTKMNANADVLATQSALTSAALITEPQTLTDAHIGKRVSVNLAAAGGTLKLKRASTCVPDSLVWLVNVGSKTFTIAPDDNSGDSVALGALNPGEAAVFDTDGVHAWRVLLRGRTWAGDETVSGNLTVAGSLWTGGVNVNALNGDANLALNTSAGRSRYVQYSTQQTLRWTHGVDNGAESGSNSGSNFYFGRHDDSGKWIDNPIAITRATGVVGFSKRPTFGGMTPWDTGNFNPANYLTSAGTPTLNGSLRTTGYLFAGSGANPGAGQGSYFSWNDPQGDGITYICCNRGGGGGGIVLRTVNENNTVEHGRFTISASGVGTNGSDARLKYGVKTISNALERVRKLRGVIYRYKATGEYHYGLVAQEVKPHFPCAVSVTHSTDEHKDLLGVSYNDLIGPLIEAVKELANEVDAIKASLASPGKAAA
ncbi:tail fiber domain-containing protein [Burkholderia multivorans]|uniref:tail fiber domain-containing protein n=1 Tax=Burkholderia multivorans TaxID=87883 RepID=UPI00143E37FD|nr:tail fiber domain-containing protein [Burkholderia multivorans]QIX17314.1 tail fiber domain-containing protein [Burkholderia multivorans]